MKLLAIFLPCVYFFITGNIIRSIFALILMVTIGGWIFASIWAVSFRTEKLIREARR
ncbi:hypothetical protein [Leptospira interrogans]|uniref:hypothetical protein n=1 Tax=Leptospira interrogans TaxID=173 RepID=UPI000298681B|nr:hypothetical protein [Leptospira interrogans]EKR16767.1 hypothetical protein LEP1GSC019_0061 [Leptospira interrogans serovar Pyrogenes str. 2006006960]UMQ52660.1 hypothetical protein FH582_02225 [Leptospira interrogans]UMQ52667.1 hypothetical protein FH582_01525 [Leptospira interrogans]